MSYEVVFSPEFRRELLTYPIDLQEVALDEIERLITHPVQFSRAATVPDAQYQVYEFFGTLGSTVQRFEIWFQYSQDEQSIHLLALLSEPAVS